MRVVYHGVPRDIRGDVIYPLNRLAEIDPRLYELQRAKYAGREATLDFRVPGIDVLFNDTVHCAAIHPYQLYAQASELGFDPPRRPQPPVLITGLFYEIPLDRIVRHPVVWYSARTIWISAAPNEDVPLEAPAEEFEPFDADRYRPLETPPPARLDYLRRVKERGERPLLFVHIPHVLIAGPIDVSGLKVVAWDEPPST